MRTGPWRRRGTCSKICKLHRPQSLDDAPNLERLVPRSRYDPAVWQHSHAVDPARMPSHRMEAVAPAFSNVPHPERFVARPRHDAIARQGRHTQHAAPVPPQSVDASHPDMLWRQNSPSEAPHFDGFVVGGRHSSLVWQARDAIDATRCVYLPPIQTPFPKMKNLIRCKIINIET